ncbi:methionine--tRNA ligase, partial [Mesorhizobium sp. M2D.F.Ca.ET.145.01.1.1]
WALKKTNPERMETVLWTTAEVVRRVAVLCQPFIPGSAGKLLDLLAVPADRRAFAHVHADHALVSGTQLPAPEGVFPRYVEQTDANA